MKNFLKISCAAAVVLSAGAAFAQSGSDVTGPTPGTVVTFAPLPVPTSPTGGGPGGGVPGAMGTVTSTGATFSGGGTQTSPATNQPIPQAASQAIGQIISTGSGAAVTSLNNALTGAGAQAGPTNALTQALQALSGATPGTAFALIQAAAQAFNAFVASAPASFFATANLPPQFLAVHAALTQMVGQ